jgi:hypothetical protein
MSGTNNQIVDPRPPLRRGGTLEELVRVEGGTLPPAIAILPSKGPPVTTTTRPVPESVPPAIITSTAVTNPFSGPNPFSSLNNTLPPGGTSILNNSNAPTFLPSVLPVTNAQQNGRAQSDVTKPWTIPPLPKQPPSQASPFPSVTTTINSPVPNQAFTRQIPYFLENILSTPVGSLSKMPLWVVVFDGFPEIVKQVRSFEPYGPQSWDIEKAFTAVTGKDYNDNKGCLFTQSVEMPAEGILHEPQGLQFNGFIRSRVGQGRQDFDLLSLTFFENNVSFVDNVLRPWTIITGHLGMIAREGKLKYRSNITLYRLGLSQRGTPPHIIQRFDFFEVCPVNVYSAQLNYSPTSMVPTRQVDLVYQWYTTDSRQNINTN